MKQHKQFTIITVPQINEILSGILWELDIEGIQETGDGLIVFGKESSKITDQNIIKILESLKRENLIETFNVELQNIDEVNWNEEWEKTIDVIKVSESLVIKPTFKDYIRSGNETVITIDPKMSFGTGVHETTKLVLNYLEEMELTDKFVLDVGSGTAVLSIASALFGARSVVAIDNDEWCFLNGHENVERNDVGNKVELIHGEIDDVINNDFDIIIANINKNILIEIADNIKRKLNSRGQLVLSGLLDEDETSIKELYKKKGFQFIGKKSMNEWIALKFCLEK